MADTKAGLTQGERAGKSELVGRGNVLRAGKKLSTISGERKTEGTVQRSLPNVG